MQPILCLPTQKQTYGRKSPYFHPKKLQPVKALQSLLQNENVLVRMR